MPARFAILALLGACAGSSADSVDAAAPWSDSQKCANMCQSYCLHKNMCDNSSIEACRMALDHADGGTCVERANLFHPIPQQQVEDCIAAVQAMGCVDFLRMYDTGTGVPASCQGILI
jgi:hypothetical protein